MKRFLFFVLLNVSAYFVNAQKSMYVEVGGTSLPAGFSLNYDRQLINRDYIKIGARIGVGLPVQSVDLPTNFEGYALPVGLNYTVGTKKLGIEVDFGVTPFVGNGTFTNAKTGKPEDKTVTDYVLFVTPGLRYQINQGLLLKFTLPQSIRQEGLLGKKTTGHAQKFVPGLSVGYSL
jgi:hypothetical protein